MEDRYKDQVLQSLKERNATQNCLKDIVKRLNTLVASEKTLYEQKLSLEAQNIALTHRNRELETKVAQGGGGPVPKEVEEQLKAKQEELNDSYKIRSDMTRQILELTQKVNELEKEVQASKNEVTSVKETMEQERQQAQSLLQGQEEREVTVTVLKQELLQLQVELIKAEEKLRDSNKENNLLRKKCFSAIDSEVEKKNAEFRSPPPHSTPLRGSASADLPSNQQASVSRRMSSSAPSSGISEAFSNSAPLPGLRASPPQSPAPTNSAPLPAATPGKEGSGSPASYSSSGSGFSLFGRKTPKIDLDSGGRPFGVTVVPRQCSRWFKVEKGELNSVAFSPSGTHFITGGIEKVVRVWDSATCRLITSLHGAERAIMSVSFSPSGEFVLAASNDNAVRVWDFAFARAHSNLMGHSGKVYTAKFTGDSLKVVTGSHDRTIRIWDIENGYCNRTINCASSCNDLDLTRDYNLAVSGHLDCTLRCWDIKNGENIQEIGNIHNGQITSVSVSRNGQLILTNSRDNTLNVIDTRTFKVLKTLSDDEYTTGLNWTRSCFSPDGRFACAGATDGSLFIWDVNTGKLEISLENKAETEGQGLNTICSCSWNPLGSSVVTTDRWGTLAVWG